MKVVIELRKLISITSPLLL